MLVSPWTSVSTSPSRSATRLPGCPGDYPVEVLHHHVQQGELAVCPRELTPWREALEERYRLSGRLARLGHPADEKEQTRKRPERVSLLVGVPKPPVPVERLLPRLDRLVELPGHVALVRAATEKLGAHRRWLAVGEPERARVLGGGLAMGAERGGPFGGCRGELEHSASVARRLGVMREPCKSSDPAGGFSSTASTFR